MMLISWEQTKISRKCSTVNKSLLLDTNALLWVLDPSHSSLGERAIQRIKNADRVYVSAASIFEMQIKSMIGKLEIPNNLVTVIDESNMKLLDINAVHAEAIKHYPKLKKHDPFDRLLLAQSRIEKLPLLTADEFLLGLSSTDTIDARK